MIQDIVVFKKTAGWAAQLDTKLWYMSAGTASQMYKYIIYWTLRRLHSSECVHVSQHWLETAAQIKKGFITNNLANYTCERTHMNTHEPH